MPLRAPPLTLQILAATCGFACTIGRTDVAVALCLGFHCVLRAGELIGVCAEHINVGASGTGVVALPLTKSGQRRGAQEIVTIDDPTVGSLVLIRAREVCSGLSCPNISSHVLCEFFRMASVKVGIEHLAFRPYSLRRGGAAHDYLAHGSVQKTILRGRWSDLKVARVYINDVLAVQTQFALAPAAKAVVADYEAAFLRSLPGLM